MCHSWSRHVLEMWCVGEWGCIVVQKIKAPLQLLPVTEESVFFLNGVDVWFITTVTLNYCLLSLKIFLLLCLLLEIPFPLPSLSSILQGIPSLIMSSFLSNSAIGMGGSDSRGSIQHPLKDREVISIGGFSSEDTHHGASNSESSSSKRLRVSCHNHWFGIEVEEIVFSLLHGTLHSLSYLQTL